MVAALVLLAGTGAVALGQDTATSRWWLVVESRERWLHEGESEAWTRPGIGRDERAVEVDAAGRVVASQWSLGREVALRLPPRPRMGLRWREPLTFRDSGGRGHEIRHGERIARIAGDTTIGGRRHWIVVDTLRLRIEERREEPGRTFRAATWRIRRTEGAIVGRSVLDPQVEVPVVREDATQLAGTVTRESPGQPAVTVRVRFEGARHLSRHPWGGRPEATSAFTRFHDSTARADRILEAALRIRLHLGDSSARDSLLRAVHGARDSTARVRAWHLALSMYPDEAHPQARALLRLRAASGDAAFAESPLLWELDPPPRPLDLAAVHAVLARVRDPRRALALGLDEDEWVRHLAEMFTDDRRGRRPDAAGPPCRPEACRALEALWPEDPDPRLRELGLLVRARLAPAPWADSLRIRAPTAATRLLQSASMDTASAFGLVDPLPPRGAGWTAWYDWIWLSGSKGPPPSVEIISPIRLLRVLPGHRLRVRLAREQEGRVVADEWRDLRRRDTTDIARAVVGALLLEFDRGPLEPDSVLAHFLDTSREMRELADLELRTLHARRPRDPRLATHLSPEERASLTREFVSFLATRRMPWATLPRTTRPERLPNRLLLIHGDHTPPLFEDGEGERLVEAESVPLEIRDSLPSGVRLVPRAEWIARDPRAPGVLHRVVVEPYAGPFVRIALERHGLRAAPREEPPDHWRDDREWIVAPVRGVWTLVAYRGGLLGRTWP